MLFEFHRIQNGKKPGTIHATYLISGTKRKEEPTNGAVKQDGDGDDYMQSSPPMSSMPQPDDDGTGESSVLTITLTREEDLEGMRSPLCTESTVLTLLLAIQSQYELISSIHIYSLGPHPLKVIPPSHFPDTPTHPS
jgi:DNA polymerase delta subunit 3